MDVQPESLMSEQHRTWSRAAGHGQHARKRAMGWMRCKRTPCSSYSSLSPGVLSQPPSPPPSLGFPHTAKAFWLGAFGSGGGDGGGDGGDGGGDGGDGGSDGGEGGGGHASKFPQNPP